MNIDRRPFDPFAPPPAPANPETVAEAPAEGAPAEAAALLPDDLDDITKSDLIALAELAGVAIYGTKVEIAGRIRDAVA